MYKKEKTGCSFWTVFFWPAMVMLFLYNGILFAPVIKEYRTQQELKESYMCKSVFDASSDQSSVKLCMRATDYLKQTYPELVFNTYGQHFAYCREQLTHGAEWFSATFIGTGLVAQGIFFGLACVFMFCVFNYLTQLRNASVQEQSLKLNRDMAKTMSEFAPRRTLKPE